MTQQTTMDRIFDLILSATQAWTQDEAAEQIAAEIDALTRERDEAQVTVARVKEDHNDTLRRLESAQGRIATLETEVERLRPAAEAWEAFMLCRDTRRIYKKAPYCGLLDQTFETWYSARVAFKAAYKAVCRARAAKGAA